MSKSVIAAFAGAAVSASAMGALYQWNYNGTTPAQNATGGRISSIASSFDSVSEAFSWDVAYSDGATKGTNGYTLVVGPGPNPNGTAGQYAIIYFDATSLSSPKVSIYRYSGQNDSLSWQNPADLLATNQIAGSGILATATQSGSQRRFVLSFDATAINNRYSAATTPSLPGWIGLEYGAQIGVWFHSFAGITPSYNSSNKKLTAFKGSNTKEGWFDAENLTTTLIPAPGSAALVGIAGLIAARRRRA